MAKQINLDDIAATILLEIMQEDEERFKALAKMRHTTEAERYVLMLRAAVCQSLQAALEQWKPMTYGPDWSASEPPEDLKLRAKLPQELLDDLNATVKEQ